MNINTKNKRGVALLISYMLLIGLSLMLAAGVYAWLMWFIPTETEKSCHADLSLILHSYNCSTELPEGIIKIKVRNKGLFNISSYVVKVNNEEDGMAGRYPLCKNESAKSIGGIYQGCNIGNVIDGNVITFSPPLAPGGYNISIFNYGEYDTLKQIEIQPMEDGIICKNKVLTQKINCQR